MPSILLINLVASSKISLIIAQFPCYMLHVVSVSLTSEFEGENALKTVSQLIQFVILHTTVPENNLLNYVSHRWCKKKLLEEKEKKEKYGKFI